MARPLRIEFPGAWYHVMNRGTGKRPVFKTEAHFQYFLSLLDTITERFSTEVHAYCLMGNHYQLMLRTPEGDLQRSMRLVNGVYSQYFNRTQKTNGALFRGRYKAILIDAQTHWLGLSRSIHRNPLAANIVEQLETYSWSSYPAYIGKAPQPDWLHTRDILEAVGKRRVRARYRDYVEQPDNGNAGVIHKGMTISPILGDNAFKQSIQEQLSRHPDVPGRRMGRFRPTVQHVLLVVSEYYDVTSESLLTSSRGRGVVSPARSVAMYLCQQRCSMKLAQIAAEFGLASYASAGSTIRNIRRRLKEDKQLQNDLHCIMQDLTPETKN